MFLDLGLAVEVVEGGWYVGPCNIPIIDWKSFSNEHFLKEFANQKPFVLRDGRDNRVSTHCLKSPYFVQKFDMRNEHEYKKIHLQLLP